MALLGATPTTAWPLATVAEKVWAVDATRGLFGSRKIALAPLPAGGLAKLMTPPLTGSTGLLAVTVTASGLANAVPTAADCGVLSGAAVSVKPWLSKAPMSVAPKRGIPR